MADSVSIKKSKHKYAEEVAGIKPLEQFGIDTCGVTWESLFRKHLAFDVLSCGGLSCEGDNCLQNEIGKDCNC
jgi:hypothetical protein